MIPEMQRRLKAFVDRVKEMSSFCEMLDTREKPIMYVWGAPGLGKTSLFYRMQKECDDRKLRKAVVIWTDTCLHDYKDIMCKVRDDVQMACFQPFSDEVNSQLSVPYQIDLNIGAAGPINLAVGAEFKNVNMGDIAMLKANQVVLPMADMAAIEKTRMRKLTGLFFASLAQAQANDPLVLLFDAVEKMSVDTSKWIRAELLQAVSEGRFANLCLVFCGRERPQLEGIMREIVEEAELQPLQEEHIVEYLAKRSQDEQLNAKVPAFVRNAVAKVILDSTKGRPDDVAIQVEIFIKECKKDAA